MNNQSTHTSKRANNKVATKDLAKSGTKPAKKASHGGKAVHILTTQERIADMRAFGQEQGRSKAAALAFLQRAGIVTETGKLTEPFRTA